MTWGMSAHQVEDHGIAAGANTPTVDGVKRNAIRRVASAALDALDLSELLAMLGLEAEDGR